MKLLPTNSFVRPWHRQSLKSLNEDIANASIRKVDLTTGAMLIVDKDHDEFDWPAASGNDEFDKEWEMLKNFNEA